MCTDPNGGRRWSANWVLALETSWRYHSGEKIQGPLGLGEVPQPPAREDMGVTKDDGAVERADIAELLPPAQSIPPKTQPGSEAFRRRSQA